MLRIKQWLIFVLIMALSISSVSVYAGNNTVVSENSSSSGSSGGDSSSGGGGGTWVAPSQTASVSMSEFTAKGTIQLPEGFVAPVGGIDIYGGFGGVTFQDISLLSVTSSNVEDSIIDDETIEYEKVEVIATIPQGKSSVSFEKTFSIASASDAFYGEFWVYDTDISSKDGRRYLSNKMLISNIIRIKPNKFDYANINVTMECSENKVDYEVVFDDSLISEKPNQTIFVIADDGYDKYITKQSFTRCDEKISGSIRTGNDEYELKYYIPSTNLPENQKITTGVNNCGVADLNAINSINVNAQNYISGSVARPDNDDSSEELNLKISTSKAAVNVTIPKGRNCIEYIVGAVDESREYINVEVLNSDCYKSGYYDGYDFYDYKKYYDYISESVENLIITLQKQCIISGEIKLPSTINMAEKTWFRIYVEVENEQGTYFDSEYFIKYSDKDSIYKFYVPYEYKEDEFLIKYHYENYAGYEVSAFPSAAKNPLPYYPKNSSGGSTGGGGGNSGSSGGSSGGGSSNIGILGYTEEMPSGLLCDRLIFSDLNSGTFDKSKAHRYVFDKNAINSDITLAKDGEIKDIPAIGGYFTDVLSIGDGVNVKLLDYETKSEKYSQLISGGKYIFNNVTDGKYIISVWYNNCAYYYTGDKLSTDIDKAKIVDINETPVSYSNDMYYDNIFPTDIMCRIEKCIINGNSTNARIGIYDIYGNCRGEFDSNDIIRIDFSPFVLSVNGKYVSEYKINEYMNITQLTDDFDKAAEISAQYRNCIKKSLAYHSPKYDGIIVDVEMHNEESLSNWLDDGNYSEPTLSGDTFLITSPEELAWISYKVKTGSLFVNKTVKLVNNIDLSAHQWTPIGGLDENNNSSTSRVFQGTFDGNGHTVNGLKIGTESNYATYEYCGLFGYTSIGNINNITLNNIEIYNNGTRCGGAIGYSSDVSIDNLRIYGNITGTGILGGIVGEIYGSILNCLSDVQILSTDSDYSGGIVGKSYYPYTIENCVSFGENKSSDCGGGMAGYTNAIFKNCYSNVTVSPLSGSVFAYYFNNMYSECYYNSDKGIATYNSNSSNLTKLLPKTTQEIKDSDFLKALNNNSNFDWNDWIFNDEGYPVVSDENNRFWQYCEYDLTENDNTYNINTPEELAWIAQQVNAGETFEGKTIFLEQNIDLSAKYWLPIGNEDNAFSGIFDGNNHKITGLKFNSDDCGFVGLFGKAQNAIIKNIELLNADITGREKVGALCGSIALTKIENCSVTGCINGVSCIGGAVGWTSDWRECTIKNVTVNAKIAGEYYAGGIVGYVRQIVLNNSELIGEVHGTNNVGGLIGYIDDYATLSDCFSNANINGEKYLGGVVGRCSSVSIENCYSNSELYGGLYVGSIIGYYTGNAPKFKSVYWNIDRAQREDGFILTTDSRKGIGNGNDDTIALKAQEFDDKNNFTGWDFENIWCIDDGFPEFKRNVKQYDYTIGDISVVGNYVVAYINKNVDSSRPDTIYYAAYANGKLVDLVKDELNVEKGGRQITSSKQLKIDSFSNVNIKVFIWSESLMPVAKAKEF